MKGKSNVLGDIRAEADTAMLDLAFYESPDYKTLLETSDRAIVVGRRGTGKSALSYMLSKHWEKYDKTEVIKIAAKEDQIIGLRPSIKLFGDNFKFIRAGSRVIWRYALLMEIAESLSRSYKYKKNEKSYFIDSHLNMWRQTNSGFCGRTRSALLRVTSANQSAESNIGDLAQKLNINEVEKAIRFLISDLNKTIYIVIDRVDEGYEPDELGIGLVDGLVHSVVELNTKFDNVRSLIFLRDNIFRAIAKEDPDFSRNLEGQIIRLHWDEYDLFNLVVARLKLAFSVEQENASRVWNRCTANSLKDMEGFRKCLRLTLYRPRDVLMLLNDAFLNASRKERVVIIDEDIETTAKNISKNRLDDLSKEYNSIFPGLTFFVDVFKNINPEIIVRSACNLIEGVLSKDIFDPIVQQHIAILSSPKEVVRDLYRIGFLGVIDNATGNFVFCHDGRDPVREFNDDAKLLVHPCYWMGINATRNSMDIEEAEEIYDEYDIEVVSGTPEQRVSRLGSLMSELNNIELGEKGASQFENWCLQSIKIIFAGALRNIELHPNKNSLQRRDVVATNLGDTLVWKRIHEDYSSRQVIFEIKNFENIGKDEYRQMLSYLTGDYGKMGFIVCRSDSTDLKRGEDLDWMHEMYYEHDKTLIVKITGKYLSGLLSKLRSPQRHDAPDKALNKLLDIYTRTYLSRKHSSR